MLLHLALHAGYGVDLHGDLDPVPRRGDNDILLQTGLMDNDHPHGSLQHH